MSGLRASVVSFWGQYVQTTISSSFRHELRNPLRKYADDIALGPLDRSSSLSLLVKELKDRKNLESSRLQQRNFKILQTTADKISM